MCVTVCPLLEGKSLFNYCQTLESAVQVKTGGQLKMNDGGVLATLYPFGFKCIKSCTCKTGTNIYFILTLPFLLKHTTLGKLTAIFLDVRK